MLISLNVTNIALIKQAEIMFGKGLNIITGETGAGKSLVIGSVNLALGGRAANDIIRNGQKEAEVELVFSVDDDEKRRAFEELEIPVGDDGLVILRRTIKEGRSVAKINTRTVTASVLRSAAEMLIDIHGQHEHQSLLYKSNHMKILDGFAAESLSDGLSGIKTDHRRLQEIKKELASIPVDERERARQTDLLRYEIDEIEKTDFKEGEDVELEEFYTKLKNTGKLSSGVSEALLCVSEDNMSNAVSCVGKALSSLKEIEGLDEGADTLLGQLSEIESLLGDFSIDANNYLRETDFSEDVFEEDLAPLEAFCAMVASRMILSISLFRASTCLRFLARSFWYWRFSLLSCLTSPFASVSSFCRDATSEARCALSSCASAFRTSRRAISSWSCAFVSEILSAWAFILPESPFMYPTLLNAWLRFSLPRMYMYHTFESRFL